MAIFERIIYVYNDKGSKQAVKDVQKLERNFKDAGKKIAKAFGSKSKPLPKARRAGSCWRGSCLIG